MIHVGLLVLLNILNVIKPVGKKKIIITSVGPTMQ